MNGHECYIIGAGDFFGLRETPDDSDYVIAADAGYAYCKENHIIPDLVLGDFDSLGSAPKHPNVIELPIEKDDTDTMYAIKLGLEKGYRRFYLYGALGGVAHSEREAAFELGVFKLVFQALYPNALRRAVGAEHRDVARALNAHLVVSYRRPDIIFAEYPTAHALLLTIFFAPRKNYHKILQKIMLLYIIETFS